MMRHLALIWRSEAVRYLFFGACTTLVNILCFSLLIHCGLHYQPANVLSWIAAVSFAFVTNKYLVFHSRCEASVSWCAFLPRVSPRCSWSWH